MIKYQKQCLVLTLIYGPKWLNRVVLRNLRLCRQQLINDLLAQAPPPHLKQRMVGLTMAGESNPKQAGNPMATCLQISQKMWVNVLGEKGLLDALRESKKDTAYFKKEPAAKVLSFERYKSSKQV